jgi:phosphoribosylformylglycinamidine synthase
MHIIPGARAVSAFRIEKLLPRLQACLPALTGIEARYMHFLQCREALTEGELRVVQHLLDYGERMDTDPGNIQLLVTPRMGTQSPWSSKATDILKHCGMASVTRVERGTAWTFITADDRPVDHDTLAAMATCLHDRMTETVHFEIERAEQLFAHHKPGKLVEIDLLGGGMALLEQANSELGLALSAAEMTWLEKNYRQLGRNPTDVELMMFAQANSEHCRHKIFNARWRIDGRDMEYSLFDMIRQTHEANPGRVLSAYSDNAAVAQGYYAGRFYPHRDNHIYEWHDEDVHLLMKVETHNHPTAISALPGAATGAGGEIRDESATGRGAKPKAGMTGFCVSNLRIPGFEQPWESDHGKPDRILSALEIMLDGPIGAAAFNNEFGRPALAGYFRSYEQYQPSTGRIRGYHKPVMIAGGYGMIRPAHVHKHEIPPGARLVVLGGPAMLIGLGGGAASSMASGTSHEDLDFASVQRHNPEMQRRCQEVIDRCWALGSRNPIISIHDVGAGGLSNALPELVSDSGRGAHFELRKIPSAEPGLSPLEIWCNEAQERYVLAIDEKHLAVFEQLCERERAPFAVLGYATSEQQLVLSDALFNNTPINMPLAMLLGKLPRLQRSAKASTLDVDEPDFHTTDLDEIIKRLLHLPAIADKRFLISIGDRSVSGLVIRDQMVGPWQLPVADCAVTASGYGSLTGEAMAVGERTPMALVNAPASGRMAVGEAITNIAAARILSLEDIALSANWMAACDQLDEDYRLYTTVAAVSELCRQLGICIPVGKDSLSMNTVWNEGETGKQVTAPLSVIISAFAPVADVTLSLTPQLQKPDEDTAIVLLDLGNGRKRLGGSCLTQVFNVIGGECPDVDDAETLHAFFRCLQILNDGGYILAYHDRSDGGLFVTLMEMCLAGRTGMDISLDEYGNDPVPALFNEELGAVIQVREASLESVLEQFNAHGLDNHVFVLGNTGTVPRLRIRMKDEAILDKALGDLQAQWSATSLQMQVRRDNPECAREEYAQVCDMEDPGLGMQADFPVDRAVPGIIEGARPRIAVLREQGVNGQVEMAAAFDRAGFECVDLHMSDLGQDSGLLKSCHGLVACGGFSFGDVLGAGGGWAKSILYNESLCEQFQAFFTRSDTFALGVCNGCQMFSQLRGIIPGAADWPDFVTNRSEQFEARLVKVRIEASASIFFDGLQGSLLPIVVAHGEGRTRFGESMTGEPAGVCLRYVDNHGRVTERYPGNPNGSAGGVTGLTSTDGRFTIMMPHPERVFLQQQFSWIDESWPSEYSPWMAMFNNARRWLD